MIKLVARRRIRPECAEAFRSLAAELVEKSRAEAGNLSYTLNRSLDDPMLFCFLESWKDQAAIDFHNASEHFTRIVPQFAGLTEQQLPLERYAEE